MPVRRRPDLSASQLDPGAAAGAVLGDARFQAFDDEGRPPLAVVALADDHARFLEDPHAVVGMGELDVQPLPLGGRARPEVGEGAGLESAAEIGDGDVGVDGQAVAFHSAGEQKIGDGLIWALDADAEGDGLVAVPGGVLRV